MEDCESCEPCSCLENAEDLPTIITEDRRLPDITNDVLHSLLPFNNLFQRGGLLCRLREREPGKLAIEDINAPILKEIMSRCADYRKTQMD